MSVLSSLRARKPGSPTTKPTEDEAPAAALRPAVADTPPPAPGPLVVTPAQKHFFDTFGFVAFRGAFAHDIAELTQAFEDVFEREATYDTHVALHFDEKRSIIPNFIDKSDVLVRLRDDPRVVSIIRSLIGDRYDYADSDGNLFYCDTSWHPDTYGSPLDQYHVKLSFYLDPLHGESGAIRVIPGTNHWESTYAWDVRSGLGDPSAIEDVFGISAAEVPSWTLESEPGDVIVWNFRTVHASFNGGERRRLFSVNFREAKPDDPATT